jgi:hypothetical protein
MSTSAQLLLDQRILNVFSSYRYVYQVVVPKALAPKELVHVFESGNPIVLPPWDPMVCHLMYHKLFIPLA